MLISAIGIQVHQFWMMIIGSGVIGGIGLGLGYISPVSTLIKWFPDRRGMATGMAIMGFGGGAMIGSPLAALLMKHFATPTDVGVMPTFIVMAIVYFVFMIGGAFGYRIPPLGWKPAGWTPPPALTDNAMITQRHVHVKKIWGIPQFWLVWLVLTMNVSAGIGVIGIASPMLQEIFAGNLIGVPLKFTELDKTQLTAIAGIAAGFAALISLFNIVGRFFWASLSDKLGRKVTYTVFFVLGGILYASIPGSAAAGSILLFVAAACIILSMYGGGFSTVPAYLADLFGTQMVGAIHGRLLTAWSTAGILGPVIVNYMREYQLGLGIPRAQVYNQTMYILVGLLVIGLICNLMIRPLADKWFMSDEELAEERRLAHERASAAEAVGAGSRRAAAPTPPSRSRWPRPAGVVGIPLAWGVYQTLHERGQVLPLNAGSDSARAVRRLDPGQGECADKAPGKWAMNSAATGGGVATVAVASVDDLRQRIKRKEAASWKAARPTRPRSSSRCASSPGRAAVAVGWPAASPDRAPAPAQRLIATAACVERHLVALARRDQRADGRGLRGRDLLSPLRRARADGENAAVP